MYFVRDAGTWVLDIEAGAAVDTTLDLTVLQYGQPGGDVIGTFTGTALDYPSGLITTPALTGGFFKVLRLEDDAL